MLLGAMLAGMAFANAPVAAVHALAYPDRRALSRRARAVQCAGAAACAALQRAGWRRPHYAELERDPRAEGPGSDEARSMALVETLSALTAELGLETRLTQVGIAQKDLPALAEDAMKQTRLLVNNPREVTYDHALAIYQEAL